MDLAPFKGLIKEKCGLSFEDLRGGNLVTGICKRMSLKGMDSHGEYLECLMSDQEEFQLLVSLLTINETYFFREPAHIQLLTGRVLPEFLGGGRGAEKIRILSAGCSTGEEPYSLVMSIMEKYGLGIRDFVSVTGADIDDEALDKAKKGIFNSHSFRGVPDKLKEKYFEVCGDNKYRIRDLVRERVSFRKLNLLGDEYPPEFEGLDIIFYRNVSIYFESETQEKIFSKLAGLLREKGVLFVSSTETISHNSGILSLVEMDGQYFFRKDFQSAGGCRHIPADPLPVKREMPVSPPVAQATALRRAALELAGRGVMSAARGVVPDKAGVAAAVMSRREEVVSGVKEQGVLFDEALSLAKEKKYDEALGLIDGMLGRDPSYVGAYMLKAGILLNMKRPEESQASCLQGIERDKWCVEAYLLLGLIARGGGDDETARMRFKEALYINPSIWPAHFYLAEIYREAGNAVKACREYEIVAKLLGKGNAEGHGFTFFPLSVPAHQIEHLCKHNISRLRKRPA